MCETSLLLNCKLIILIVFAPVLKTALRKSTVAFDNRHEPLVIASYCNVSSAILG